MVYWRAMDDSLRARLRRHARFERAIRDCLDGLDYVHVDTPVLAPSLIPEPTIEVFQTEYLSSRGRGPELWLVPSPELWMKRLLGRGSGDIYQIARCFRNGDFGGPAHNPEFRLLEWYTTRGGYMASIDVAESLFSRLLEAGRSEGWFAADPGREDRLSPPFARLSMEEAFRRFAGIELSRCQNVQSMRAAGREAGIGMPADCTWEQAFHVAFLSAVEPALPRGKPLVLTDYPALVPTTARRKPGTPWAERWELFVDGVEIANCYTEETDSASLERLLQDEDARKKGALVPHRTDWDLARAFPAGFPVVSGAALGVDRLEMVFLGERSLEGVIVFPFSAIVPSQSGTS
ncbi:MAG TPA: amino acid--tRNA ligase-related protein [Spirochaetia bacterium]|nr:amino acid--tRNA ligase-related protein [Spirochaetia bacterium]